IRWFCRIFYAEPASTSAENALRFPAAEREAVGQQVPGILEDQRRTGIAIEYGGIGTEFHDRLTARAAGRARGHSAAEFRRHHEARDAHGRPLPQHRRRAGLALGALAAGARADLDVAAVQHPAAAGEQRRA